MKTIKIKKAAQNNLKNLDLEIPHNKLVVITGVSGSGKSSLAFNTIFQEGQRHFLESLSTKSRQLLNKLQSPKVEEISGMRPAIALNQHTSQPGQRSTLGTLTGINDLLRLLFARCGKSPDYPSLNIKRSLFSFNSPLGACPTCNGLGIVDKVDPSLLIKDDNLSIREGAFEMTTPTGYIVYSQVTQDVLNDICNAHDFSIDIPWKDLTDSEKNVILFGSNRLKVPFGKHTLESRLKWSGITAKPREEGYYKGIIPVMEEILRRDRNENVLRFTRSHQCPDCNGKRLNHRALSVKFAGKDISYYCEQPLTELINTFTSIEDRNPVFQSIRTQITGILNNLINLGLGYLSLNRRGNKLTMGELQRARLASLPSLGLQNMVFVLDEPSAGLHMQNIDQLIKILHEIRDLGNSVIIVEHDLQMIRAADWLIDLGPGAGEEGGYLLFSGPIKQFMSQTIRSSQTQKHLQSKLRIMPSHNIESGKNIELTGVTANYLNGIDITLSGGMINLITGISGSGARDIVEDVLIPHFQASKGDKRADPGPVNSITGLDNFKKLIWVDQKPIGRTSRSNPATYTKVFDHIRKLFAGLEQSKQKKLKAGDFSFNNKSGRCDKCEGNGYIQIGMHFMEDAHIVCDKCNGKRYKNNILHIKYRDHSIADVLEMSVEEAYHFLKDQNKISNILQQMIDLGIGYLKLGQPSTTLSGGEAQRIKLAAELSGKQGNSNLYVLNEPSGGLHPADNELLIKALKGIANKGNLIVITDQDPQIIMAADNLIELGPGSNEKGGNIIFSGHPSDLAACKRSVLSNLIFDENTIKKTDSKDFDAPQKISLSGVKTHNLKNLDLSIERNRITTITGLSGSGKSSLLYDTIFSESNRRFTKSLSAFARSYLEQSPEPDVDEISGLTPAVAISQQQPQANPRSTVGTFTGIYDHLRLFFSRIAQLSGLDLTASEFSFNHQDGACLQCRGLGIERMCDADLIIEDPSKPLFKGALVKHKTVKFYLDDNVQYPAIMKHLAEIYNEDTNKPWKQLSHEFRNIIMYGTGGEIHNVIWDFKRGNREGTHNWETTWPGLTNLISEEYQRKHIDHRGKEILPLLKDVTCSVCNGSRLKKASLDVSFAGFNIAEICNLELADLHKLFSQQRVNEKTDVQKIFTSIQPAILKKLSSIIDSNLSYLTLSRTISTLSAGETQRLRIANQIDASITGITYIFDEPGRSLHPHNRKHLHKQLQRLKAKDNTILLIEHDPMLIKQSDVVIELGPKAGESGGHLIFQGSPEELKACRDSITAKYLNPIKKPDIQTSCSNNYFAVKGVSVNNIDHLDIRFCYNAINMVTGVSGSGKTSLIFEALLPSLIQNKPINCSELDIKKSFNQVISINNTSVKSNLISSVATFSGIMNQLRKIYSSLDGAQSDNLKGAAFSYTNKTFQCPACKGKGINKVSMDFMSDIITQCSQCKGKRYRSEINKYKYKGYSIADIMDITLMELAEIFKDNQKIIKIVNLFKELGLDYLTLGQSSSTLSGGEKQRLLLIKYLLDSKSNNNLFIFDEPSKGLHPEDCRHLIKLIRNLQQKGNTIIMIEHNLMMIAIGDDVADMRPGAGSNGGKIVERGDIITLMQSTESLTGEALRLYYQN